MPTHNQVMTVVCRHFEVWYSGRQQQYSQQQKQQYVNVNCGLKPDTHCTAHKYGPYIATF